MKKATKIIIILTMLLGIIVVWDFKTYKIKSESSQNINKTVEENKPMLVDLGSGTCTSCKQMLPVLEDVKKLYEGKAEVKVIDVYENQDETNKYNIRVIPTQIFLDKNGKEFYRHEGFFSKEEIVKVFDKMGVK